MGRYRLASSAYPDLVMSAVTNVLNFCSEVALRVKPLACSSRISRHFLTFATWKIGKDAVARMSDNFEHSGHNFLVPPSEASAGVGGASSRAMSQPGKGWLKRI